MISLLDKLNFIVEEPNHAESFSNPASRKLSLEKVGRQQVINVRVPKDITSKDSSRLGDEIIKIVKCFIYVNPLSTHAEIGWTICPYG
jgi:hypothetical protein